MGSRKGTLVQIRMDPRIAEELERQAEDDRRTKTAQAEWLVEQERQRRESGAEPAVRVERLELRVQGWRETAESMRRDKPMQGETRATLDAMADAYERAAKEIEMEIRTRG